VSPATSYQGKGQKPQGEGDQRELIGQARIYGLNVKVTRKGAHGFKRTAELQAC
jgi:hypothetical protein